VRERQTGSLADAVDVEADRPLGVRGVRPGSVAPEQLGTAGQLEDAPTIEIHEQQAGLRAGGDVAERLEHRVALVVREDQRGRLQDAHEAGHPAPVGDVGAALRVGSGDEEGVCAGDPGLLLGGERVAGPELGFAAGSLEIVVKRPPLDVLRAVREHLLGGEHEAVRLDADHGAVHPHPAARGRLDGEHADPATDADQIGDRIVRLGQDADADRLRIERPHEAGRAEQRGCPDPSGVIGAAQHYHRLIEQELPSDLRDAGLDDAADLTGDDGEAGLLLDLELAFVERGCVEHGVRLCWCAAVRTGSGGVS
jgi:hypothetical protein